MMLCSAILSDQHLTGGLPGNHYLLDGYGTCRPVFQADHQAGPSRPEITAVAGQACLVPILLEQAKYGLMPKKPSTYRPFTGCFRTSLALDSLEIWPVRPVSGHQRPGLDDGMDCSALPDRLDDLDQQTEQAGYRAGLTGAWMFHQPAEWNQGYVQGLLTTEQNNGSPVSGQAGAC